MHLIALSMLIQIACAVHCLRSGRSNPWLMVIIFLSIPGCIAYILFEVLPQFAGHREIRRLKQAAARKLDPDRDLRSARAALETADTAANRIALGDALADQGKWAEAIVQYEVAEVTAPGACSRRYRRRSRPARTTAPNCCGHGCTRKPAKPIGRWRSITMSASACPAARRSAGRRRC